MEPDIFPVENDRSRRKMQESMIKTAISNEIKSLHKGFTKAERRMLLAYFGKKKKMDRQD